MNQKLRTAWLESSKLYAESDILWLTTVISVYGTACSTRTINISVKWDGDKCILNVQEIYG